jgi:hypothetical protein
VALLTSSNLEGIISPNNILDAESSQWDGMILTPRPEGVITPLCTLEIDALLAVRPKYHA